MSHDPFDGGGSCLNVVKNAVSVKRNTMKCNKQGITGLQAVPEKIVLSMFHALRVLTINRRIRSVEGGFCTCVCAHACKLMKL